MTNTDPEPDPVREYVRALFKDEPDDPDEPDEQQKPGNFVPREGNNAQSGDDPMRALTENLFNHND